MVKFKAILQKFGEKGEKTGWTYFSIPVEIAQELNPGIRISYRVKGSIDNFPIKQVAFVPMGNGDYIIPFNQIFKKNIHKNIGDFIDVSLEIDTDIFEISPDLLDCLADDPTAKKYFEAMSKSHQRYFSNWIESAKTIETKSKRIAQSIFGLGNGMDYGMMIRHFSAKSKLEK